MSSHKIYYLSDLAKLKAIAKEMNLKVFRLENMSGSELQKYAVGIKPDEQLDRIFAYLQSELIPDNKYLLVCKTGAKAAHRTEILIQKGNEPAAPAAPASGIYANNDFTAIIKENAVLKADNYYLQERLKVLEEHIAELKLELEEEEEEAAEKEPNIYEKLAAEYAPQIFNIISNKFIPAMPAANIPNFADAAPAPAKPIIRFSAEYFNYWRNCNNQDLVNKEYEYLATNKPDKVQEFLNIWNNETSN